MSGWEGLNVSANCQTHIGHKLSLFCPWHNQIVCNECVEVSHSDCKSMIPIEEASIKDNKGTLIRLKYKMEEITHELEVNLGEFKKAITDLEKNKGKIRESISSIRAKIIDKLLEVEHNLIRDLEMKYVNCKIKLLKAKKDLISKSHTVKTLQNDIKISCETSNFIEQFEVLKYLDRKVENEKKNMKNFTCNTIVSGLQFQNANQDKEFKSFNFFGSIHLTENHLSQRIHYFERLHYYPPTHWETRLTVTSLDTSSFGSVSVHRGCVEFGKLYFINGFNRNELISCNTDGSDHRTIKLKSAGNAVAMHDRSSYHFMVATDDGIEVINTEKWSVIGQILTGAICQFIASNGINIVICTDGRTIIRLDDTGEIWSKFTTSLKVRDIDIDRSGCIYYIDYLSEKIHVIEEKGNERVVFSSPDLIGSTSLAVDKEGDIYTTGSRDASNIIYRISIEEQTKNVALITDVFGAKRLSFTDDELLVMDQNSQLIQIHVVKIQHKELRPRPFDNIFRKKKL